MKNKTIKGVYFRIDKSRKSLPGMQRGFDISDENLAAMHHLFFENGYHFAIGEYAEMVKKRSIEGTVRELMPEEIAHSKEMVTEYHQGKYEDKLGKRTMHIEISGIKFNAIKRGLERALESPTKENLKLFRLTAEDFIYTLSHGFLSQKN